MQKKKGVPQKKKAAVYSPEALLLRTLLGVLLIALGILSLISVVTPMDAEIFKFMQKFTRPVGGELCLLFPIFLTWAGILVAFSSRRRMPARALVLSFLIYWFALGVITLVTFVWDATDKTYYGVIEYAARVNARTVPISTGFMPDMIRVYELQTRAIEAGGLLGAILAWPLYNFLGTVVSVTILVLSDLGLLILLSKVDLKGMAANFRERSQQRGDRRAQEMAERQVQEEAYRREQAQRQAVSQAQAQAQAAPTPAYQRRSMTPAPVPASGPSWRSTGGELYDETIIPGEAEAAMDVAGSLKRAQGRKKQEPIPMPRQDDLPWEEDPDTARELDSRRSILKPIRFPTPKPTPAATPDFPAVKSPNIPPAPRMSGQRLDEPDLDLPPQKTKKTQQLQMKLPPPYAYPTLEMLKLPKRAQVDTRQEDEQRAAILEETLMSFGISAQVRQVTHGPTVTRFELELASGINVKRITSLTDTIAMNLAAGGVRIEAPIPNKALVGVEVPNREIISVTLREVLESEEMNRADSPLSVALGKDIAGMPIICDLGKMPHLLIAGATGSGKSVCINSIICSLLFRTSPKQVRMLLIDPKVVELQCYNGIPHLLTPVVSDPHKAAGALTWAVQEMMERYQKFKERNVRGITGYNAALMEGEEAMPRIVVIIDELADLMMASKREVEESICRIAQLARAAGIHLVVATQRPSVDVITGLIKNNLPSRIAFAVASSIDARTIMERAGAEKLLGKGDMLYAPAGALAPLRVQGSFVSDDEVNRVTDFIRGHSTPDYDPNVQELLDQTSSPSSLAPDAAEATGDDGDSLDELLSQAIEMAIQEGQTSISMLQRKMRIGYARAGRLIDEMTKRGIISQAAGAKPRKVLISQEEFDRMDFS
jgi:S-DNA-T family DNA segregation ATPase FtsK/SpoIIIE